MAHEITRNAATGKSEMAFTGETPWHKLGQSLPVGASVEEFLVAAGMEWVINRSPVSYVAGRGAKSETLEFDGQSVLYRSDNREPLGVVSSDYQIVQPYEVLEFFRSVAGTAGAELHTAGTLFGGKRFWALAKMGEASFGADKLGNFLLLTTSADGTIATTARQTSVRVVCNNTLSVALAGQAGATVKVSHRQRFDAARVKRALADVNSNFEAFCADVDTLCSTKVSQAEAQEFIRTLLRGGNLTAEATAATAQVDSIGASTLAELLAKPLVLPEATPAKVQRAHPGENIILELFNGGARGSELATAKGTAWGLVNAVTEYVDHYATAKSTDHRLARAWFSTGDEMKSDAFEALLART